MTGLSRGLDGVSFISRLDGGFDESLHNLGILFSDIG